jgi:hypothetical protein
MNVKSVATKSVAKENRRSGSSDRRIGLPDNRNDKEERRLGPPDRRIATVDKIITVITSNGDYRGTINLYSGPQMADSVGDFFMKSNLAFLPLYNATVKGLTGKVTLLNFNDIAVVISQDEVSSAKTHRRREVDVSIRLNSNLGYINGKVDLCCGTREVYRVSDLLNYSRRRWLTVYDATMRGKTLDCVVVNYDYISSVEG